MATLKYSTSSEGLKEDENKTLEEAGEDNETSEEAGEETADSEESDDKDPEGADALMEKARKALRAMKQERNAERAKARDLQKQLDELRAEFEAKDKTPDEQALDKARAEARAEAITKANQRVLRSEIKSLATGQFRDPSDALAFLDLSEFEVSDNGDVDVDDINEALQDLLERKPHLAAQGGASSFDSARGKRHVKKKLSPQDLKGMSPQEIVKARREGRIDM